MQRERFCYHYLNNEQHGKALVDRINDQQVIVDLSTHGVYDLDIDVRDKRVLICFDGGIPSGGLPKGSTVIMASRLPQNLSCDMKRVYKKRSPYEEEEYYIVRGSQAVQALWRNFILLKTARAVFRMYRPDTLQPRYLIVDVHDGIAEFSTSSY